MSSRTKACFQFAKIGISDIKNMIFESFADACDYINQKRSCSGKIGQVIQGKRKTFAGYHWEGLE